MSGTGKLELTFERGGLKVYTVPAGPDADRWRVVEETTTSRRTHGPGDAAMTIAKFAAVMKWQIGDGNP